MAIAEWLIQQLDRAPDSPAPDAGTRDVPFTFKITNTAKVVYLTHGQSPQQLQSVVNQIRSATKIQRAYPYNSLRAIALSGSMEQLTAATALLKELDTQ